MSDLLHFDALPPRVRETIFLKLGPSDLNNCLKVSKAWSDFIVDEILRSERNKNKVATHRHVFGKIVANKVVDVDTTWMLGSLDDAEKHFYVLSKPAEGNNWLLQQYPCDDGLGEPRSVTLATTIFVRNMQVVGGHLVLFKQPTENEDNPPVVFSLESIPWGATLNMGSGIPLPNDAFHFRKLLQGKDCLFVVSKNAHVTWTKAANGGAFNEATNEAFAEATDRPVVVHRLSKQSGTWQEVAKLHPEHPFEVMERFANIPSKDVNPKYKDQTCLLYLSNNIITERYILVSCPLHGSYQCFDLKHDFPMWQLKLTPLPFENIRSILKNSLNSSCEVLAAIRDAYVFIKRDPEVGTLVSVESGEPLREVKGRSFVLSPRHVLPVEHGGKKKGYDVTVVDAASGKTSPTFTFQRQSFSMDAFGDLPWHHDDEAYADFEGIARQLLPNGPKWPIFESRAEMYWGFGHAMIDASRLVFWARNSAKQFKLKSGSIKLDFEG